MRIIRVGDAGEDVRDVQTRLMALGASIDPGELEGGFGPSSDAAVRTFQAERRLPVDGMVGPDTWAQLVEAGYAVGDRVLYLRYPFLRGDDVRELQRRLNALGFDPGREDGILGRETDRAIRDFQRNVGREIDGIVGPDTIAALDRLRPDVDAPSRAVIRETEGLRSSRGTMAGAVIALDPGHGPGDGITGAGGLVEGDVAFALAELVQRALTRAGATPLVVRDRTANPSPSERAGVANAAGAELFVSLHLGSTAPEDSDVVCAYFGTETTYSPAGRRLAELIQSEFHGRLALANSRIRPLAISILRETKMPAVAVKPCDLADPEVEARLRDPAFVRNIARSIAAGIVNFLSADARSVEAGSGVTG